MSPVHCALAAAENEGGGASSKAAAGVVERSPAAPSRDAAGKLSPARGKAIVPRTRSGDPAPSGDHPGDPAPAVAPPPSVRRRLELPGPGSGSG